MPESSHISSKLFGFVNSEGESRVMGAQTDSEPTIFMSSFLVEDMGSF